MVEPSTDFEEVLSKASDAAKKMHHEYITIEHVLYAMLTNASFIDCINGFGTNAAKLRSEVLSHLNNKCEDITVSEDVKTPKKTAAFERLLNKAFTQVIFNNRQKVEIIPYCKK